MSDNSAANSNRSVSERSAAAIHTVSAVDVIVCLASLVLLMASAAFLFGSDSSQGPAQIALIITSIIVAFIYKKNGAAWEDIEESLTSSLSCAVMAMLIMLSVGALIASWIMSGTVPTMILYGSQLISVTYFYAIACLVSAITALFIGSSWTVAGTIGIGLIGTAASMGMSVEMTAGAIISGAYFGDKLSPLSDTTNLAAAVAGADLFVHIKAMLTTTVPSITIALIVFVILGGSQQAEQLNQAEDISRIINQNFQTGLFSLVPLLLVLTLAVRKTPALPTILAGILAGVVWTVLFQPMGQLFINDDGSSSALNNLKGIWLALANGYSSHTGDVLLDSLFSRGGMSSMLNTLWLILSALVCGGLMERAGILRRIIRAIISEKTPNANLIIKTLGSCFAVNVVAADQYVAVVVPGRIFHEEYKQRKLKPQVLSRTIEDSGTITSPLVPWNTCGAFMAATLGVSTMAYLPFCIFNLVNPLVSAIHTSWVYRRKSDKLYPAQAKLLE